MAKRVESQSEDPPSIESIVGDKPFVIDAEKVKELKKISGFDDEALLRYLVPVATRLARPPISEYRVGIAGLGKIGAIYLGVNLEIPKFPLNATIHGEQFLISNARSNGETELVAIALSAAPCGHCKQFLNEMGGDNDLKIFFQKIEQDGIIANVSTTLSALLPEAFGPKHLGYKGGLLSKPAPFSKSEHPNPLIAKATDAAHSSYAPHTGSSSGVAMRTKKGDIYTGSYLENAAYNPGLSPVHTALVNFVADGHQYDEIAEVVLVESPSAKVSQAAVAKKILKNIAPEASFRVENL